VQHTTDASSAGSAPPNDRAKGPSPVVPPRRRLRAVPTNEPADDSDAPGAGHLGWRRAPQCGWCRLGDDYPDVLASLHAAHLDRGVGARVLVQLAERRLGLSGMRVPSSRALSRHLKEHLVREASGDRETEPADHDHPRRPFEGRELEALWLLNERLDRRLRQLDGGLALTNDGGETDLNRIAQLSGLANAQRSTLMAINRVRSSPVTTAAGIRHALKIALGVFSEAVLLELQAMADMAIQSAAPEVAGRVEVAMATGGPLDSACRKAAADALSQTLEVLGVDRAHGLAPRAAEQ